MIKFTKDTVIFPKESSWFGDTTSDGKVIPMEDAQIYKEDLIGLKSLANEGRIDKKEIEGEHFGDQLKPKHILE